MLSTKELEQYVKREIQSRLGDVSFSGIYFEIGTECSNEGMYVFLKKDKDLFKKKKNGEYHVFSTEKGLILQDFVTCEEREVLWEVLEFIAYDIAHKYAVSNSEVGVDSRHALFDKEIEIYSLFGEDFERRKRDEIEEVLKRAPYSDTPIADRLYRAGKYKEALEYYTQDGVILNQLQKKRLERIYQILSDKGQLDD